MRPLERKLLRDLWRLKTQVLTIALVVASGVGGFIGSLSTHASLLSLRDAYYDSGRFGHVFVAARRAPLRLEAAMRAIPGVVDVETSIVGGVRVSLPDTVESMTGRVVALPEHGVPRVNRLFLRSGRWLEEGDERGVLVSEAFAKARALVPGSSVTLLMNGRFERFEVRGIALSPEYVFAAAHGGFADDTRFGIFWLSHAKLAAAYDMDGAFNAASLRLERGASPARVIAAVDRLLEPYGSRGAFGREEQPSNRALSQEIEEQQVFGTVLPAVFLAVAVFLLNVLLTRHIATERPQIAALKALGYADRSIGLHYLALVLVIVTLGALLGLGIGAAFGRWMTRLYTGYFFFPVYAWRVDTWILLTAIGIALLSGVGAAAGAVRAVVRLPPAEAMRPPAPASFRPTLAERLGFGRVLSAAMRMILRELERRPLRTALTIIGMASSVAIVIAGTWWGDAFDYLLETELEKRERAGVIAVLTEAAEPAVLHAARRLPGVLVAEGSRDVPARLRNGARSYRTSVTGLPPETPLHPLLDADLTPLPLVEGALVLTDRLARRLEVRPGDSVWVEPLEGTQRARLMPVALESGDLMGMRAYATRRDAAALAGEADSVNGLRFLVDRARLDDFHAAAREIPPFASIGDKTLLIRHFRETSQRNLLVFTGILSVFAGCIAVGVVYNSARIALAEHAWELASLRVLGFTRAEVSRILLGQVGLQILAAIPLGCVLGFALAALLAALIHGEEFRIPLVILPHTYAFAILVMLGAGVASAAIVRRRIDRLDLVGVLKTRE